MSNARLTEISVERFKSHGAETRVMLSPLTVLVGPNNGGKSTIVQALLLLQQTLHFPRVEVPLHLAGAVDANSLRELTYGWPDGEDFIGPRFQISWVSDIETGAVLEEMGEGPLSVAAERIGGGWLHQFPTESTVEAVTSISLQFSQVSGKLSLTHIELASYANSAVVPWLIFAFELMDDGAYEVSCNGEVGKSIQVNLDHFIPYISINTRNIGPRDRQRAWVNGFKAVFLQPLDDLQSILRGLNYLSSTRDIQPAIYRSASVAPEGVGVSGELAAQLLHASQDKRVLYNPPSSAALHEIPTPVVSTLQEAVGHVLRELGISAPLSIQKIGDLGFRLLFGNATLQHVGRGLTYLLPIVEMGLVGDPTLFSAKDRQLTFMRANFSVCAFEEPEAHLHPKLQAMLADWFVALAIGKRQVIVETHSDHLVRRLRYLIAQANPDSPMESWLGRFVSIVEVEQIDGVSRVAASHLHKNGDLETWPKDFMGQAQLMEEVIYVAGLGKDADVEGQLPEVAHSSEDEPYERPD
ncbi:AAA family ATPase [Stenotrophomonas sepilia]|uniref:AAA family ATPase n=1 Tax=Stenotrophomonas sepilia TaxID=2860290 RepID=UPI003D1757A4